MNWAHFKDLASTVVASWSLTQEMSGLNSLFKELIFFGH